MAFYLTPETGDVNWFCLLHWKLLQRIVNVEHHMRLAVIFNGNPDMHWICFRHLEKWNAQRVRFPADGGGCKMQRIGELPCDVCAEKDL